MFSKKVTKVGYFLQICSVVAQLLLRQSEIEWFRMMEWTFFHVTQKKPDIKSFSVLELYLEGLVKFCKRVPLSRRIG